MPKLFVPRKSDAHRLACTSLYRALLKQCNGLTSNTTSTGHGLPTSALKDLVRYRFQRDRKLQSPTNIKNALTSGHSHLGLLYHSNLGSQSALAHLIEILKTTFSDIESKAAERELQRERQPFLKITPKALHIQKQSTKALNRAPPDSVGLSAHPLPLSALKSRIESCATTDKWSKEHPIPAIWQTICISVQNPTAKDGVEGTPIRSPEVAGGEV